jgi:hypothetical protein
VIEHDMAHRNGRLGLRWEEGAALAGFFLLFTLGIGFGINWHFRTYFTRNGAGLLLIVASLYLATAFRDAMSRGQPAGVGWWLRHALGFTRDWWPFVALIVLYENLLPLVGRVHPALYDRLAMRLDVAIFGTAPSLWLQPLVTRGRTEWLSFFLPVAVCVAAHQRRAFVPARSARRFSRIFAGVHACRARRLRGLSARARDSGRAITLRSSTARRSAG